MERVNVSTVITASFSEVILFYRKVTKAAVQQMNKLWHTSSTYMNPILHEYAEKLTSKLPGDLKVIQQFNCDSSSS
jgi:alanine-glyoxylate transaminase/(R)-3-amino-2-methylpropionate-pyruvate transaminase